MATHFSVLAWRIPWMEGGGGGGCRLWGCKQLDTTKQLTHTRTHTHTLGLVMSSPHPTLSLKKQSYFSKKTRE